MTSGTSYIRKGVQSASERVFHRFSTDWMMAMADRYSNLVEAGHSYISLTGNDIRRLSECPRDRIRCIDTETTGLDPEKGDEVLQVAVVDGNGRELFCEYVRPERRKRWNDAQRVHGIKPSMVMGCMPLSEHKAGILEAMNGVEWVIGYNIGFDVRMLAIRKNGKDVLRDDWLPKGPGYVDVMREYARVHGEWSEKYKRNSFVKLADAAKHFGVGKGCKAHDALGDARMAAEVFAALLDEGELAKVARYHDEAERMREAEARERGRMINIGCAVSAILLLFLVIQGCRAMFSAF